MKKRFLVYPAAVGAIVIGVVLQFTSLDLSVFAQTRPGGETPLITRTVSSEKTAPVSTVNLAAFSRAASENARLRNTMQWGFGGKVHRGWDIYSALIAHTIGTDSDPSAPEFAGKLAKWQQKAALSPTGIVDKPTMEAFVKYWQSQRLGRSAKPSDDLLLSAPISDFWDPSRSPDLLKLERETYAAYKRMIAAASKDLGKELKFTSNGELAPEEKFLRIISAYRSPEYQAQLRKQQPNAGRAALAKNSPHFTGQALDIYVGGEPVTTKDANRAIQVRTPAYKWLVKNAHKFGFYPYFYEPWHWEYVPERLPQNAGIK